MKRHIRLFTTVMVCMAIALCVSCKKDGGNTGGGGTQTVATVTTEVVTEITQASAVCGGEVKSENGWAVTERGVCWSTKPHPTLSNRHTVDGESIGAYMSKMTGLVPGTKYYVRAYAKNAAGTGFGAERSFTTQGTGGGGGGTDIGTVSMTVTAGPGAKTDITHAGAVTWSAGDRLYVGYGGKYAGCLTLVSGAGTPIGTFIGDVTLTDASEGVEETFDFFYLGNAKDYSTELTAGTSTSVSVSFAEQDIYEEDGGLKNAGKFHVGYGTAQGTVQNLGTGLEVTVYVTMVTKVAIARFSFMKDSQPYTGALTLNGDNICNKMTVNFASTGFVCVGTKGEISLTNTTSSEKYVMLVPTDETTTSQTLTFIGSGVTGSATFERGIMPNKFYGPIEVTLTSTVVSVTGVSLDMTEQSFDVSATETLTTTVLPDNA